MSFIYFSLLKFTKNGLMKYRILHFDDEPFILKALAEILKLLGWDVTLVSEIDELFKELKNNHFDVLIMDIMAPTPQLENDHVTFSQEEIQRMSNGLNTGVILTEKIWRLEEYRDIPVLFLSARNRPDKITLFLQSGHKCEYLIKPQLAKTIDEKLRELLSN